MDLIKGSGMFQTVDITGISALQRSPTVRETVIPWIVLHALIHGDPKGWQVADTPPWPLLRSVKGTLTENFNSPPLPVFRWSDRDLADCGEAHTP